MRFENVLADIEKLVGLELSSVRPGADIKIIAVDKEKECILIKTAKGETKSRPFSELRLIWNEMMKSPAVHVEGVLMGSGTSRNQPETIYANLPYIEWLKVSNKKHIAYVSKETHAYGTVKQMDALMAADLESRMAQQKQEKPLSTIIVTDKLIECIDSVVSICGGEPIATAQGAYTIETTGGNIMFVASEKADIKPGQYIVLTNKGKRAFSDVTLAGEKYSYLSENGIGILIKS